MQVVTLFYSSAVENLKVCGCGSEPAMIRTIHTSAERCFVAWTLKLMRTCVGLPAHCELFTVKLGLCRRIIHAARRNLSKLDQSLGIVPVAIAFVSAASVEVY